MAWLLTSSRTSVTFSSLATSSWIGAMSATNLAFSGVEGLIVRALPVGHVVAFSPPLCITREQVDEVLDRFNRGLAAVTDELVRQGEWKAA